MPIIFQNNATKKFIKEKISLGKESIYRSEYMNTFMGIHSPSPLQGVVNWYLKSRKKMLQNYMVFLLFQSCKVDKVVIFFATKNPYIPSEHID